MTDIATTFTSNLKAQMSRRKVGHSELARRLGVSRQTVHRLTTGKTKATLDHIDSIAKAIRVPPHHLLRPIAA